MHAQLPLWNIAFQLITQYLSCSGLLVSSLSVSYQIRTTWNMRPHTSRLTPLKQRFLESCLLDTDQNWQIVCICMSTSLTSYMARLQTRIKIGREGANALCLDWTWKINPVYLPSNDRFVKKFFYCFKKKDWCWIHGEGVRSSVRVCEGVRSSARLQPRKWWHLQR